NAATYRTTSATLADDGATFTVRIANHFSTNQCSAVLRVRPATVLSITRLSDQMVLSWPASALIYRLQSASMLPASNTWMSVPGGPILSGGVYRVTNSISGAQKFFRVISP